MHREDLEKKYIDMQIQLKEQIDMTNQVTPDKIKWIAGVDLAYWNREDTEYAVCCIVVIDYHTKDVVEKKYFIDKVDIPYIPGCLAFRELPLFLKTKELLQESPDVYVFDGNGYLHPRHMGIATHAGIIMNKPSMGIAKSYYKIDDVDYVMPQNEMFAFEDIIVKDEIYGRVVRTQKNVKPIFLSIGNKMDLHTAMGITRHMVTRESHIPMPTRYADIMTHEVRREYR